MTVIHAEKLGSSSRVGVSWSDGMLRLHDDDLFGEGRRQAVRLLSPSCFTLREVAWVEIDRTLSTAGIHYDTSLLDWLNFSSAGGGPPQSTVPTTQMRHQSACSKISHVPPVESRFSGSAHSLRPGTSFMTVPGESAFVIRQFTAMP